MGNAILFERLKAIQKSLMANYDGGVGLPSAVKGDERETFIREYLETIFPAHYRFSSGVVTDSCGAISGQVDIAIEQPFAPSFPMPGCSNRLLLAESVAAVIEVKSDLVNQWNEVCSTTAKLTPLKRSYSSTIVFGNEPLPYVPCIAVGYRGYKTVGGLKKRFCETNAADRPLAAYVIESGAFYMEGAQATGFGGLFMMCLLIHNLLEGIASASVDLLAYGRD